MIDELKTETLSKEAQHELLRAFYGYRRRMDYPRVWVSNEEYDMSVEGFRKVSRVGDENSEMLSGIEVVEDLHLLATLAETDRQAEDDLLYDVLSISAARQHSFLLPKDPDSLYLGYEILKDDDSILPPERIDDLLWVVGRVCEATARRRFRNPYVMPTPS